MCERELGTEQNCNILTPNSYGHNGVSFPFSCAAQPGAWGPTLLSAGFLYRILSPTDWTSCAPTYIIVRHPPSSCGRHKSHSFNPSTVKAIFWYSSIRCTCYLHRCISYFDSLAGSEVSIQHIYNFNQPTNLNLCSMNWLAKHGFTYQYNKLVFSKDIKISLFM